MSAIESTSLIQTGAVVEVVRRRQRRILLDPSMGKCWVCISSGGRAAGDPDGHALDG